MTGLASVVAIQEIPTHWRDVSFGSGAAAPPMGRLGRLTMGVALFEPVWPVVGLTSSVVGVEKVSELMELVELVEVSGVEPVEPSVVELPPVPPPLQPVRAATSNRAAPRRTPS